MAGFPSKAKGNARGEVAKQPRPGIPLDKATMIRLIGEEHGNLSRVADIMGTTRYTIRDRCDKDEELLKVLKDARERQLDVLERSCFDRAIESNDTTLQLFLLKTQGKSRGYEQSEAQHAAKDIATAAFDFIISKSKQTNT
jgi:hypothetical protein